MSVVSRYYSLQVADYQPDANSSQHEVLGQIMGEFEDLNFFTAACYKGLVDLTYLSLYSKTLRLKHAPVVNSDVHATMETAFSGAELQSTLYCTEQGLKRGNDYPDEPMLSIAAKFLLDPVKNIKVKTSLLRKYAVRLVLILACLFSGDSVGVGYTRCHNAT